MKDARRVFYENTYRKERIQPKPTGILGFLFNKLRHFELHRRDAVFDLLEPGEKFLDLGCGCGSLMVLARRERFSQVYGVDIAKNIIKTARKNFQKEFPKLEGVYFKLADVDKKIPFSDNFFDTVTAVAFLEHIFDPYFVVREIKRVLKPRGIFILEVHNIAWLPYRLSLLFGKLPQTTYETGWDGGHLHYFTFKAVEDLLKENGFLIIEETTSGVFSNIRRIYPSLLGSNIIIKAQKK